jgi:hypothetical protein
MEDRLHVHQTRAKQWSNDRQISIPHGAHEHPKQDIDRRAGVAWWPSALTSSWEGARSIPNPGNPFPTLGIGASPLFQDLAGRLCSIINMARLVPKNWTPCKNWWRDSQNPNHKNKGQRYGFTECRCYPVHFDPGAGDNVRSNLKTEKLAGTNGIFPASLLGECNNSFSRERKPSLGFSPLHKAHHVFTIHIEIWQQPF